MLSFQSTAFEAVVCILGALAPLSAAINVTVCDLTFNSEIATILCVLNLSHFFRGNDPKPFLFSSSRDVRDYPVCTIPSEIGLLSRLTSLSVSIPLIYLFPLCFFICFHHNNPIFEQFCMLTQQTSPHTEHNDNLAFASWDAPTAE
jgi:hypothetical protein